MSSPAPAKATNGPTKPNPKPLGSSGPAKPVTTPTKPTPKPLGSSTKTATKKTAAAPPEAAAEEGEDFAEALKKLETKFESRLKAVNQNSIARVANSHLTSGEDKLLPLFSLKTGKPLDKFPATASEVHKLKLTEVVAMLVSLEADRTGNEEEKRIELRVQIGLKATPA